MYFGFAFLKDNEFVFKNPNQIVAFLLTAGCLIEDNMTDHNFPLATCTISKCWSDFDFSTRSKEYEQICRGNSRISLCWIRVMKWNGVGLNEDLLWHQFQVLYFNKDAQNKDLITNMKELCS